MVHRKFQDLFTGTARFSANTRMCLERSVGRALFGHKCSTVPLRRAVYNATRELRVQGLDVAATLAVLGAIVEDAGRACGADRASLLSGEPLWMPVRIRVLESAHFALENRLA